jgi:hypothetical protein
MVDGPAFVVLAKLVNLYEVSQGSKVVESNTLTVAVCALFESVLRLPFLNKLPAALLSRRESCSRIIKWTKRQTGAVEENARLKKRHNEEQRKLGDASVFGRENRQKKNALERQTVGNREKSTVSKREVGLDVLIVTVRSSLHLGQALGFEAPLAAAGTV